MRLLLVALGFCVAVLIAAWLHNAVRYVYW